MAKVKKYTETEKSLTLYAGMHVVLRRKATFFNTATVVHRRVKSIDREKKKILCDDSIEYKFDQVMQ